VGARWIRLVSSPVIWWAACLAQKRISGSRGWRLISGSPTRRYYCCADGTTVEQVNYLAGHKSMAMTKRYDHANEERYGAAIEALDAAGKTCSAEALAAARWKQR
jgi:hypothetical protein